MVSTPGDHSMALTLATIETAIEYVASGLQSFTIDGQSYNNPSLKSLLDIRTQLQKEGGSGGSASPFGFSMRPLKPPEH